MPTPRYVGGKRTESWRAEYRYRGKYYFIGYFPSRREAKIKELEAKIALLQDELLELESA